MNCNMSILPKLVLIIILSCLVAGCGASDPSQSVDLIQFSIGESEIQSIRVRVNDSTTLDQKRNSAEVTLYSIPDTSPTLDLEVEILFTSAALIPEGTYIQCGNTSIFPKQSQKKWNFNSTIPPVSECVLYVDDREIEPALRTGITRQVLIINGETYVIGGDSSASCQYSSTNLSLETEEEVFSIPLPAHIYLDTAIDSFKAYGAIEAEAQQTILQPSILCYGARYNTDLKSDNLPGDFVFVVRFDKDTEYDPICYLGIPGCSLLAVIEIEEIGGE